LKGLLAYSVVHLEEADDAAAQAIATACWDHADNYHNDDWEGYCWGMVEKLVPSGALAKVKHHLRQHVAIQRK
jgi:hypothetical protein